MKIVSLLNCTTFNNRSCANVIRNHMRSTLLILCLIADEQLFAQDTTVTWLFNIDTSAYAIYFDKKQIPQELYSVIGIESTKDIANPGRAYQRGCEGNGVLPRQRLNWIASDTSNHWIISVSYGGRASGTKFYFIDKDSGRLNSNILYFKRYQAEKLTLDAIIPLLQSRQFLRG